MFTSSGTAFPTDVIYSFILVMSQNTVLWRPIEHDNNILTGNPTHLIPRTRATVSET